uniref:Uncharacterized protein n=1 Tax=Octopus bimaculoides TaxID=37653 RepID=A0A0L8GSF7_OCTBM
MSREKVCDLHATVIGSWIFQGSSAVKLGSAFLQAVITVFEANRITCNSNERHLFIASSSSILKAVLLHNGKMFPSLPLVYFMHLKEKYISIKNFVRCLQCV